MSNTLYTVTITATSGNYEDEKFTSKPFETWSEAIADIQKYAYENGICTDWTKVFINKYVHHGVKVVDIHNLPKNL